MAKLTEQQSLDVIEMAERFVRYLETHETVLQAEPTMSMWYIAWSRLVSDYQNMAQTANPAEDDNGLWEVE